MADISTRIDLGRIYKLVDLMTPAQVGRAIARGLRLGMLEIERDTIQKISGPYLGIVTGTARRSIRSRVQVLADRIQGVVGSPLRYVRAHELGFRGRVQVPGHTRQLVTLVRRGGKVTKKSAREFKAAVAAGRKRIAYVRPHSRYLHLRARHFLRDAIQDRRGRARILVLQSIIRQAKGLQST